MKTKSINVSRYIALFSIILALTVIALTLPFVFLIPLLFIAVSFGFGITIITSILFGIISLLLSFAGGSFVALAFIEQPLIPIIPRLLVGITTFTTHYVLSRLIKNNKKLKTYLPKIAAAVVGTVTNTFFVILFMYVFLPNGFFYGDNITLHAYTATMIVSGCIELAVNIVVLPPLTISVGRALKRTRFGEMLSEYKSRDAAI